MTPVSNEPGAINGGVQGERQAYVPVSEERLSRFIETCTAMGDAGDGERYAWWDDLTLALRELQTLTGQSLARTLNDTQRLLARCHDRIHCLPRTSDTELAGEIENMLVRLRAETKAQEDGE